MKKAGPRQCQNGPWEKVYTAGTDGEQTVQKFKNFRPEIPFSLIYDDFKKILENYWYI